MATANRTRVCWSSCFPLQPRLSQDQDSANGHQWAQSGRPPVLVNDVLLEHNYACSSLYCLGHFCVVMAYLSSHNTDDPAHKNENVYYLQPFTERALCPAPDLQGLRGQGRVNPSAHQSLLSMWEVKIATKGGGAGAKGEGTSRKMEDHFPRRWPFC